MIRHSGAPGYENVAADQAAVLSDLHRHQAQASHREVADLRAELSRVVRERDAGRAALEQRHAEATKVLRRTERELRQDLALRDTELLALRETLKKRDGLLERMRAELKSANERALGAEQRLQRRCASRTLRRSYCGNASSRPSTFKGA